jgi:alkanesulfonate monooxygenase SsuD/methylene tetrahydromethanopterin reductase-like flavin-dependent oxidoreductase (luciferase family)
MIGGSGEKKTLRLVARYADTCNIRGDNPEGAERLLGILREHCEREGRDFSAIEKTIVTRFDPGADGSKASEVVDRLAGFGAVGIDGALGYLFGCENPAVMEQMGTKVIPALAKV